MNTDNLYVVIGFDPETGESWTCADEYCYDVIKGGDNAMNFRDQLNAEGMYVYRVAKLTFLD